MAENKKWNICSTFIILRLRWIRQFRGMSVCSLYLPVEFFQGNDSGPEPGTSEDDVITDSENDDDDFRQVLSLSGPSNKSARDKNQERNKPSHHQSSSGPSRPSFGAVKSATAYRASNDFGNWEKYTKGIGYKLLDKVCKIRVAATFLLEDVRERFWRLYEDTMSNHLNSFQIFRIKTRNLNCNENLHEKHLTF